MKILKICEMVSEFVFSVQSEPNQCTLMDVVGGIDRLQVGTCTNRARGVELGLSHNLPKMLNLLAIRPMPDLYGMERASVDIDPGLVSKKNREKDLRE